MSPPKAEQMFASATVAERASARQRQADAFVAQAGLFKAFYTENPSYPQAPEARRLEVKALINAARLGDTSQSQRIDQLVEVVRKDATLPAAGRCEVVAMRQYQATNLGHLGSETARAEVIERIERSLIEEFPAVPNGYEALLQLARHSDDIKGAALATELADKTAAPDFVKEGAKDLLGRYGLNGRSLGDFLPEAIMGKLSSGTGGGETVVYAWASENSRSLSFARFLVKSAPAGVGLVGVCLDKDEAKARATALEQGLGELQVYDSGGQMAAKLRFDSAPLAYIAGTDGKIRTVSGVRELSQRWSASGSKEGK